METTQPMHQVGSRPDSFAFVKERHINPLISLRLRLQYKSL